MELAEIPASFVLLRSAAADDTTRLGQRVHGRARVTTDASVAAAPRDGISTEALRTLVGVSVDGLVLLDDLGAVQWINAAAQRALGPHVDQARLARLALPAEAPGEIRRSTWTTSDRRRRHLDHRSVGLDAGGTALWLSDVTELVHQQQRITAITRAAASVADTYSLRATLDAVAGEVARTAGIAAVQIHAFTNPWAEIRVLGMAGFGDAPEFTERLAQCRQLGVRMLSIESFTSRERMVSEHRKAQVMRDPAWAPLHEIMSRPDWDTFVSVPLCVRGRVLGAMNAYYLTGETPGESSLSFLEAMADHAAVAMDTANLLGETLSRARTDERRRLARDLHDSAVQQVFSMRMQAEALRSGLDGTDVDLDRVRSRVEELAGLAANALADLRALLNEMRPLDVARGGLVEAVRESAHGIEARHGLTVDVRAPTDLAMDLDIQEDLFRIVQEALHNVVKHSSGTRVVVRIVCEAGDEDQWVVEISDDGADDGDGGGLGDRFGGLGLTTMRERAEAWGGHLEAGPVAGAGWVVRALVPAQRGNDPR